MKLKQMGILIILLHLHLIKGEKCCLTSCVRVSARSQCKGLLQEAAKKVRATRSQQANEDIMTRVNEINSTIARNRNESEEFNVTVRRQQIEIRALRSNVDDFPEKLNESKQFVTNVLTNGLRQDCEVYYRRKCFRIPEPLAPSQTFYQTVDLQEAQVICQKIGWKLANLYSEEHYNLIMKYARAKIPTEREDWVTVWLGMTRDQISISEKEFYYPSNRTHRLREEFTLLTTGNRYLPYDFFSCGIPERNKLSIGRTARALFNVAFELSRVRYLFHEYLHRRQRRPFVELQRNSQQTAFKQPKWCTL